MTPLEQLGRGIITGAGAGLAALLALYTVGVALLWLARMYSFRKEIAATKRSEARDGKKSKHLRAYLLENFICRNKYVLDESDVSPSERLRYNDLVAELDAALEQARKEAGRASDA